MKNKFTKHYTKQAFLMTSFSFHILGMDKKINRIFYLKIFLLSYKNSPLVQLKTTKCDFLNLDLIYQYAD